MRRRRSSCETRARSCCLLKLHSECLPLNSAPTGLSSQPGNPAHSQAAQCTAQPARGPWPAIASRARVQQRGEQRRGGRLRWCRRRRRRCKACAATLEPPPITRLPPAAVPWPTPAAHAAGGRQRGPLPAPGRQPAAATLGGRWRSEAAPPLSPEVGCYALTFSAASACLLPRTTVPTHLAAPFLCLQGLEHSCSRSNAAAAARGQQQQQQRWQRRQQKTAAKRARWQVHQPH